MTILTTILIASCIGFLPSEHPLPQVAIIIDDIGYDYTNSRAAVELKHPFAYAVLPFSPYAEKIAAFANTSGKDVMIHLPMEAENDNHLLGPGALRLGMSRSEIEQSLAATVAAVPYAIGINNHMGSRLTRELQPMDWLMQAIHERGGFFFVDSRTTPQSVALAAAENANIEATARDVFIDNIKMPVDIEQQLALLVAEAKRNGHALGIAHPHTVTIEALRHWDPEAAGVRLISVSDYVATYPGSAADAAVAESAPAAAECGDERNHAYTAEYPYAYW